MTQRAGSALLLMALAGCAGQGLAGGAGAPPLRGTAWQLPPAQAPEMSPPRPAELLLDASSSSYSGFTGCNRIMGSYVLAGSALKLSAGGSTRMACPGEASEAEETRFLQALLRVQAWQQTGTELRLLDAAGQTVLLLRAGGPAR